MLYIAKKWTGSNLNLRNVLFLSFIVFLLFSCKQEQVDYSAFPRNAVFRGKMDDGRMLFLVRESDSVDMSGYGFIYNGLAVVKPFAFTADAFGNVTFSSEELNSNGKIKMKDLLDKKMVVSFPKIPERKIKKQKIKLKYLYTINEDISCVQRYKEPIFDDIIFHEDLEYSRAMGYYSSYSIDTIPHGAMDQIRNVIVKNVARTLSGRSEIPLCLDIYEPKDDFLTKRPVVLLIHGGAFFFGDKRNHLQRKIAENLVKRGYVVASMNYRLGTPLWGTTAIERTIYRGVKDTRAAMRYLMNHADKYGIDVEQIYLSGSSAGAIIALTTAFMDEDEIFQSVNRRINRNDLGRFRFLSNSESKKFKIAGLISMWGGIVDVDIIDKRDAHTPTLLFHGTSDNIVHCESGLPFQDELNSKFYNKISNSWCIYGSKSIYNHMSEHNMPVKFVPFDDCGHEPQIDSDGSYNQNMDVILDDTNDFLYANVMEHFMPCSISGSICVSKSDPAPLYNIDNDRDFSVEWKIDGGIIVDNSDGIKRIAWFDTTKEGKITVCVSDINGLSCQKELQVIINN